MTDMVSDIEKLHDKFGPRGVLGLVQFLTPQAREEFFRFRLNFLREELTELETATTAGDAVDAIIDLMVVAIGTLNAFGVNVEEAWNRVQAANMAKIAGPNPNRPNRFEFPDLLKPEGWKAPNHDDNIGILGGLYS